MEFKDDTVVVQWGKLSTMSPGLRALLLVVDQIAFERTGKRITVTSLFRNAPVQGAGDTGVHMDWRGADLRVDKKGDAKEDLNLDDWGRVIPEVNALFAYGRNWKGKVVPTMQLRLAALEHHADPTNDHVHVQVPRREGWR